MKPRGPWQGMINIIRFNWPFYLLASVTLLVALAGLLVPGSTLLKLACSVAIAGAGYFLFVSLGVSHLIYDRSDLYRWRWLDRVLHDAKRNRIVFCHTGLDEASEAIKQRLGPVEWTTLDHFDAEQMTEASIQRARRLIPPTAGTLSARFDQWPVESRSADVIFGMLAIHEFRSEEERTRWFEEALRCLPPDGRIILVEHLRDTANFLAFGPGFLHFHSPASWQRCWKNAGLHAADQFRITPWIRIFVIVPS